MKERGRQSRLPNLLLQLSREAQSEARRCSAPLQLCLTRREKAEIISAVASVRVSILEARAHAEQTRAGPVGVCRMEHGRKYARAVVAESMQEKNETTKVIADMGASWKGLHCLTPEEQAAAAGKPLCGAWRGEKEGWVRVDCILDSGASESVCPISMCPEWPVEDSPGSKVGLHYTSASGGRIRNRGQQRLPIELSNGTRSHALFQVAEVSRPLISVAAVCATGNVVIFGVSGGVIRNLATGAETPFSRVDGIYQFTMWVPPPSLASDFLRQP